MDSNNTGAVAMYQIELAVARKHLSMVRTAQRHLGPAARFVNAGRIRNAEAVVESLETLVAIVERDGGYYADSGEFVAA